MAKELITGDKQCQAAVKKGVKRLSDGSGLYLLAPAKRGSYGWRFDYTFQAERKTLSLGTYPEISLADARKKAEEFRTKIATGVDPSTERKAERRRDRELAEVRKLIRAGGDLIILNSFRAAALRWHSYRSRCWTPEYAEAVLVRMKKHLFPTIGSKMLDQVTKQDISDILDRIEASGALDTANRVRWICKKVYERADGRGLVKGGFNPASGIDLNPSVSKRLAAVTDPIALGPMLNAMDSYAGGAVVRAALRLLPMVAMRPGTLRYAAWDEFDLDDGWWKIPASRMKWSQERKLNGAAHWVPLPAQAVQVLRELHPLTGGGKFVFPNQRSRGKPMSENTINAALRALGFARDVATGHGFRSTARTILDEVLFVDSNLLEVQLGHSLPGPLANTYARVEYKEFRWFVMQMWADYLDALRKGPAQAEAIVKTRRNPFGPRRLQIDDWQSLGETTPYGMRRQTHTLSLGTESQGPPLNLGRHGHPIRTLSPAPMSFDAA